LTSASTFEQPLIFSAGVTKDTLRLIPKFYFDNSSIFFLPKTSPRVDNEETHRYNDDDLGIIFHNQQTTKTARIIIIIEKKTSRALEYLQHCMYSRAPPQQSARKMKMEIKSDK